jgi:16S rRNA (uracil1498-N3)-methyltransferase
VDSIRGGAAELRGDEARHLTRVLRVEPGQRFEISDNRQAYLAQITEARGERVVFEVIEALPPVPSPVSITLCASLIKFDRFEWIVEKATELGVDRILPVEATRTEKGLFEASRKRRERWQRIARESSQQARRVRLPEILPAVRLEACLEVAAAHRYFLDESLAPPLLREIPSERADTAAVLIRRLAAGFAGPSGAPCRNRRLRRSGSGRECLVNLTGQGRKTIPYPSHSVPLVGQALPPANRRPDQELAGESACPTIFHRLSRAAGPSQQTGQPSRLAT